MSDSVKQSNITAQNVAARDVNYNITSASPFLNPGLKSLIDKCLTEIDGNETTIEFFKDLQYFSDRRTTRNLRDKFTDAGLTEEYYEDALFSKESFAKFFEVIGRHATGQKILVAAFRHAFSVYNEKIKPHRSEMTFKEQQTVFESDVVLYLSLHLTGLPEFYGRNEAIGLIYHLADLCFIDYCHV